jgi:hypothetical protein
VLSESANIRSFVFLGDNFLLGSTLAPPALLVYNLEQRPADANTPLLRFLFGPLVQGTSDILLTSDPSPGWTPSAGLQVPFHIAGDERIIAMNIQLSDDSGVFRSETFLIPTKTLLAQIDSLPTKEGNDVDWDLYDLPFIEDVTEHGRWDVWTCFVFGMRYILPRAVGLHGKPIIIIRDLSQRRCLRASEEEREESNTLYQAMGRGSYEPRSRSILKCVPLPESIRDAQHVRLMISEDGIVVFEQVRRRKTCVFIAARLMRLGCRETPWRATHWFICSLSDELSLNRNDRFTVFVRVVYSPRFISPSSSVKCCWAVCVVA